MYTKNAGNWNINHTVINRLNVLEGVKKWVTLVEKHSAVKKN